MKTLTNEEIKLIKEYIELKKELTNYVKKDLALNIWEIWQKLTKRYDRYTGCPACFKAKLKFLDNFIEKYKDQIFKPKRQRTKKQDNNEELHRGEIISETAGNSAEDNINKGE